jgi:LuxR family maltose regulon positive regulatory protein
MSQISAIPITIPRLQPGFVLRPELDAILDSLGEGEWLAVVAPAGFGKSQLAAYWYERSIAAGIETGWGPRPGRAALCLIDDADHAPEARGRRVVTFGRFPVAGGTPSRVIDAEDLRLTMSASAALVRARGGRIDHAELAACEGWPPALNLLAQASPDMLDAYLENQVMARLSEADRAILADLALLPDLRAPLVEAVLERADGASLVERLVRETPFFRTIDGMHSLATFARQFLLARERGTEAELIHQRAAAWLVAHAPPGAVPHLLAIGDLDRACRILDDHLFEMVTGGDLATALDWLTRIGAERIAAHSGLSLAAAHAYATVGDHGQAQRFLASHGTDERLVLQSTLASHADDADTGAHIIQQVTDPGSLDPVTGAIYRNLISWIEQKRGNWSDARNSALLTAGRSNPGLLSHAYGHCRAARWELAQGRAGTAIAALAPLLDEADTRLGRASAPSALVAAILAYAQLQAGDADGAAQALAGRAEAIRSHNVASTWALGLIAESRLAAARGDPDAATAALDTLDSLASSRDVFSVQAMLIAERIRLMVTDGRLAGTMTLAGALERLCSETRELRVNGPHIRLEAVMGLGHLAIAQGNAVGARRLFGEALGIATAHQRLIDVAEIALVCPDALAGADRAAVIQAIDARDLAALARRLGRPVGTPPRPTQTPSDVQILDRPQSAVALTARELDVLVQLGEHRSNKMIARELGLSGETVKWHVANLLAKLGARDRSHAVERARALGLLTFSLARAGPP